MKKIFKRKGVLASGVALLNAFMLVTPSVYAAASIESISSSVQAGVDVVRIDFTEPLTEVPNGFAVQSPARIALDFPGVQNGIGRNLVNINQGNVKTANVVQVNDRTRVVLNLKHAVPYKSTLDGNTLLVSLTPASAAGSKNSASTFSENKNINALPLQGLDFRRGVDNSGRVIVDLANNQVGVDIQQQGNKLVVDFMKTSLPEGLRRRLDVSDFGTPVQIVSAVQNGDRVRMTIEPKGQWEHSAYQSDNQLVIEVRQQKLDADKLTAGAGYRGEKLSLNFQNIEVRALLQVIADFTNFNVVTSDTVVGNVTLRLKDVPWDQALDIILKQKDLDMRKNGNVILVAPREEFAAKEKLAYEARAQLDDLEPLVTETFTMNYVKGEELRKLMIDPKQTMLSKRGSVLLDSRSNIMIIKDTQKRIEDIRTMLAQIDIPLRQVMIEARIVEAGDSFAKNLGIRLSMGATERDGQNGGLKETDKAFIVPNNRTAHKGSINLPATPRASKAGTYALTLFGRGFSRFITAEISALEADGKGKIISSPRVMTSNQNEALIEQGVEIPYQEASSSGATSVSFKKANLSLKVKPQITPDGKVAMILDINKDTPNTSLSTGSGVAIDTKHVKTEVLVDNGGTVVIGGIYTQTTSSNTNRIPLLGDLPYIGWLFKNREWIDDKTELLVFITPRIMAEGLSIR